MKTAFVDVDTQLDFVYPAGALYVPGAEGIIPVVERLNRFAGANSIVVIATADAHAENDPEFLHWPPHCVAGTLGQRKPQGTLLERRVVAGTGEAEFRLDGAQQVIAEKQALDCFTNPNFPEILRRLGARRYVVYGVVTEFCVRCAALGLLRTGGRVEVVTDAVRTLGQERGQEALREIVAAGGSLTTSAAILG